jgi:hypothetical protein
VREYQSHGSGPTKAGKRKQYCAQYPHCIHVGRRQPDEQVGKKRRFASRPERERDAGPEEVVESLDLRRIPPPPSYETSVVD